MQSVLTRPAPSWGRRLFTVGLAVLVVATIVLVVLAAAAGAQVATDGDASPDTPVSAVFTVNNTLVTLITGLIVPLVTGLLLRPSNPEWVKVGAVTAVTALATAFLSLVQDDGTAIVSQEWLVQALVILVTAIASYLGIWNPLTARQGGLNAALPTVVPGTDPPPP